MKIYKYLIICAALFFCANIAQAQEENVFLKNWSLSVHYGIMHGQTDIRTSDFWGISYEGLSEHQSGFGLSATYMFNNAIGIQGRLNRGKLLGIAAPDYKLNNTENGNEDFTYLSELLGSESINRAVYFNTPVSSISTNLYINLTNIAFNYNSLARASRTQRPARDPRIGLYALVGVGFSRFDSELRYVDTDTLASPGKIGLPDSDPGSYTEKFTELTLPLGVGLKGRISDNLDIGIEYVSHFMQTDKVDAFIANNHDRSKRDMYSYTNLNLTVKIGGKNSMARHIEWANPIAMITTDLPMSNPIRVPVPGEQENPAVAVNETPVVNQPKVVVPEPILDTDKDGVPDKKDKEPNSEFGAKVDSRGVTKDTDNDGCPDHKDPQPYSSRKLPIENCVNVEKVKEPVLVDSDNDGIPNDKDKCPNTPGVKSEDGCPEIVIAAIEKDSDNDGILDKDDDCPNTPGIAKEDGCPEVVKVAVIEDRDGDGILDRKDKCPDSPGLSKYGGCPEPTIVDTDGDGVEDRRDRCPTEAGKASNRGCPEVVVTISDRDNDGVIDKKDKCPDTPGLVSKRGCPDKVKVIDSDRDGIADAYDKCPEVKGVQDNFGCPLDPVEIAVVADSDNDGVKDDVDRCPNKAGSINNFGCPPEPIVVKPKDSDGDGIIDPEDSCPSVAGVKSNNGCPAPKPVQPTVVIGDKDGDGVKDDVDRCPDKPGSINDFGCPKEPVIAKPAPPKDTDGDGVIDIKDNCPEVKGTKRNNGCPKESKKPALDSDGDGIVDAKDQCPNTPGTRLRFGCPEVAAAPAAIDTDNDGVLDKDDNCPTQAGLASNKGCPETKPAIPAKPTTTTTKPTPAKTNTGQSGFGFFSDRDSDGVSDVYDKCPDVKGTSEKEGCP